MQGRAHAGVLALAATLTLTLTLLAAPAASAQDDGARPMVADSGFRPAEDGYSFANYGDSQGYRDLTAAQMRRLFGARVCATLANGRCVLSPTARRWMRSTNKSMAGGHCMGFAVTSQLWFEGKGKPPAPGRFGAPTVPGLDIENNPNLQSHIAWGWTIQLLPAAQKATVVGTPSKVLAELRRSLRTGRATYTALIFDSGGGHAVTPYAIERRGGGKRRILIYDNNKPGKTAAINVNVRRDRWSYTLFGSERWSGNAKSKSLRLLPPEAGVGRQPCFFCGPTKPAGRDGDNGAPERGHRGELELRWGGDPETGSHGSLSVSDRAGRRSGCGAGGCINEIPGAELVELVTGGARPWTLSPPPVFRLPAGRPYEVTLGGGPLEEPAREGIELIGEGYAVSARGIALREGERDTLRISGDGHRIAFDNDVRGVESPQIGLATSGAGAHHDFEVSALGIARGGAVSFDLDPARERLRIELRARARNAAFDVRMRRIDGRGRGLLEDGVRVRDGGTVVIDYGRWRHDDQDIPAEPR